jgi:glycosyltransferase involved in cell wall biosynthesis
MKFDVIIPVYNTSPEQLLEAVASIVNQNGEHVSSIIIGDDYSDNYQTISALHLAKKIYNRKTCKSGTSLFFCAPNKGISYVLNKALKLCTTEYIARMDSSDISHPNRLKMQSEYLEQHPDVDVLGTNLFSFKSEDIFRKPIYTSAQPEDPTDKTDNWIVNHGTVVYRKSAVLAVGGYNESLRRGQDLELWGRMRKQGYIFRNITDVLYAWRK